MKLILDTSPIRSWLRRRIPFEQGLQNVSEYGIQYIVSFIAGHVFTILPSLKGALDKRRFYGQMAQHARPICCHPFGLEVLQRLPIGHVASSEHVAQHDLVLVLESR